jgi:hypothetical protein
MWIILCCRLTSSGAIEHVRGDLERNKPSPEYVDHFVLSSNIKRNNRACQGRLGEKQAVSRWQHILCTPGSYAHYANSHHRV